MPDETMPNVQMPRAIQRMFNDLVLGAMLGDGLPSEESPTGVLTRELLTNNWLNCRDGLLQKTTRIRVRPEPSPFPRAFHFEIDCPFKSKMGPGMPVELMPGPVRGTAIYRPDLMTPSVAPSVAVALDFDLGFFHPNYSRRNGFVCLGEIPSTPLPLDLLLENFIYPIVTYQNRRPAHPYDKEAAIYFALDPNAMTGLEPVEPLY